MSAHPSLWRVFDHHFINFWYQRRDNPKHTEVVVIAVPGTLTLEYLAWNSRWDFLLEEGISYWKKEFLYVTMLNFWRIIFADFVRCFCGIAMVTWLPNEFWGRCLAYHMPVRNWKWLTAKKCLGPCDELWEHVSYTALGKIYRSSCWSAWNIYIWIYIIWHWHQLLLISLELIPRTHRKKQQQCV